MTEPAQKKLKSENSCAGPVDPGTRVVIDSDTGYKKVELSSTGGGIATVYLHGAHLASCKTASGVDMIFMSKEAVFDGQKALRGGVPICFPQFSDMGTSGSHGFARNAEFELALGAPENSKANQAKLVLQANEKTLAAWPHHFKYSILFALSDESIRIEVEVANEGSEEFSFTTALHTYFRVDDIQKVAVQGLGTLQYMDNLQQRDRKKETEPEVRFKGEVDRIYLKTPNQLFVRDEAAGRTIVISKDAAWQDAVLWNPWVDKAAKTKDLGDNEYNNFVCVEMACCGTPVVVHAKGSWTAGLTYSLAGESKL